MSDDDSIQVKISVFLARDIVDALRGTRSPYLMALSQEIQAQLAEVSRPSTPFGDVQKRDTA